VVLYTELLCYHPYLVSMLFADLLSYILLHFKAFYSCYNNYCPYGDRAKISLVLTLNS